MMDVVHVVTLAIRMHALWPDAPIDRVVEVARVSVEVQHELGVSAEMMAAIAEHESDLRPNAVSWVEGGRRHDSPPESMPARYPRIATCGYLQAMSKLRSTCDEMIARDGGMRAGARELLEWTKTCRGDVRCVLRGHAGGTKCATLGECTDNARAYARLFLKRAVALGARP